MEILHVFFFLVALSGIGCAEEGLPTHRDDLFEGDMKLTPKQRKAVDRAIERGGNLEESASAYGLTNVYPPWKDGVVVYTFHHSIGSYQQAGIRAAMHEWTTATGGCITFRRRTNEPNYLEFHVGSGCWGNVGQPNGKSQISVGPGCHYQHVMSHEIGHALGFWHEQSRPDRDSYLQVLWQNIPANFRENFNKYGRDKIDSLGVPFDYTSIMQYPWNAFATNGRDTLRPLRRVPAPGPYKRISPSDAKQARLFYKCGGTKPRTQAPSTGVPPVTKCVGGGVDPNCRDKNRNCASWARRGECTKNPDYMKTSCCKSCNAGSDRSCVDSHKNCRSWARNGECDKNPGWMHPNCKKSCNKCSTRRCFTVAPPSPPIPTTSAVTKAPPPQPTNPPTKAPPRPPTKAPSTDLPPTQPPVPPTQPPIPAFCMDAVPAGVANKSVIDDSALSASTSESPSQAAKFGRLGNQPSSTSAGAWCAAFKNKFQYFQVDLGRLATITGIKTQGRDGKYDKYVTKYKVSSSTDGATWYPFRDGTEFEGNSDTTSVKEVKFNEDLRGRFVRIMPTEWSNMICMRIEIMVCDEGEEGSGSDSDELDSLFMYEQ